MNTQDSQKIYLFHKRIIERKLYSLLHNKSPQTLYEPCSYILKSKGKRIRAILVLLSAKAVGGNYKDVYNAAVAVEILHNFTLVHDDIMDNANKRRGLPTVHVKYDLSTAILAGDNLIAVAYQNLLKDCKSNCKNTVEIFTKGIIEVCEGQSLDKEFESRNDVTLDEYLKMINKKTAALAEMCCNLGANICEGNKEDINSLKKFGRNLGIAFQIQDDLLDIIADETKFGKVVGGDLIEGKKTYLFLRALEKSTGNDLRLLKKIISNNGIKINQVKTYSNLYFRLGIIDDTEKAVFYYTKKALKAIENLKDIEAKNMLCWLANALLVRTK